MWWLELRRKAERHVRVATNALGVIVASALLAGCFQPLYGDRSASNSPSVREAFGQIDVAQIPAANGTAESRLAVEIRNQLMFGLRGGGDGGIPTHQLKIRITSSRLSVVVDVTTARPDVEQFGLNATYELIDLKTGKPVLNGNTFSRVSYDIPGQEQRFARARGLRDAETRAAKVIAENIQTRLASFFYAQM
jgi:LPS-assembly lipoprotein